jgi:outer membrane lipoprotein-sorting protein
MYKILFIAMVALFVSCNKQANTSQMEQRITALEAKVDSLEHTIKLMTSTDSILVQQVFSPAKGSLLEEIQPKQ